jgi:hypothetical protein
MHGLGGDRSSTGRRHTNKVCSSAGHPTDGPGSSLVKERESEALGYLGIDLDLPQAKLSWNIVRVDEIASKHYRVHRRILPYQLILTDETVSTDYSMDVSCRNDHGITLDKHHPTDLIAHVSKPGVLLHLV